MSLLDFLLDEATATSGLTHLTNSLKTHGSSNNVWFRYRNLDFGQSCTVRFLPATEENAAGPFWQPRKIVRLKFADPVNVGKDVNINIPVMQMYVGGKPSEDPVLGQAIRLYEQADALEKKGESEKSKQVRSVASAHYIRGEAIAQCFVINPGFMEQDPPEKPIRLVELNKQIIKVITAKLNTDNPELKLDFWPCHGRKGYNFIIKKTRTGDNKYPKWDDGTGFSTKTSPLTQEQLNVVDTQGLWDLTQFLPARPGDDEYKVLAHMVSQSIAGDRVWNPDWEAHLEKVKIYRTEQADENDDKPVSYSDEIKSTLSNLDSNSSASSTADVMASLNRTASHHEEPEPVVESSDPDDGPVVAAKSGAEVRNIVAKLKREQEQSKTATAE